MSEPCRIMDDDELERASKKVDWRNGNSFQVRNLFIPAKTPAEFPRAFQPGRQSAFTFRKSWSAVVKQGPKTFRPLVDLSGTPVLTAESIAEFGVPLLPMPELKLPETWGDDPPYAPCTPPVDTGAQTSATADAPPAEQEPTLERK